MKLYRAFFLSALLLSACSVSEQPDLASLRNFNQEQFGIDDGKGTSRGFVAITRYYGLDSTSGYYGNWLNYTSRVWQAAPWVQTQIEMVLYVLNAGQVTTMQPTQFGLQVTTQGAQIYPLRGYSQEGGWSLVQGYYIAGNFTSYGNPVGANAILYNNFQASPYIQPTATSATIYVTASTSAGQTGTGTLTLNASDFSSYYNNYYGFQRRAVAIGELAYLVVKIISQNQNNYYWWSNFGGGRWGYNWWGY